MDKPIIIDAAKQKLGRVASEIAKTLRGKTTADFLPNRTTFPQVVVINSDTLDVSERRLQKTMFSRYSGYPGGKKNFSALDVAQKSMPELLRRAVWGMLPKNKLRSQMIKNLVIFHGNTQ